jgi:hypothetical protein
MSSQRSRRRTPDAVEHRGSLAAALDEVAAGSFFACVEPLDPAAFADAAVTERDWISVLVRFDGAFGGELSVALPGPLASELHAAFLGRDPGETPADDALFDLVGELGNMICGRWLTRACGRRRFELREPAVARASAPDGCPAALHVTINGRPACVQLRFRDAA